MDNYLLANETVQLEKFNSIFTCITSCIIVVIFALILLMFAKVFETPAFYFAAGVFCLGSLGEIIWRLFYFFSGNNIEWLYVAYRYVTFGALTLMIVLVFFFRRRFSLRGFLKAFGLKPQLIFLILSFASFLLLIAGIFLFDENSNISEIYNQLVLLLCMFLLLLSCVFMLKNADLEEIYSKNRPLVLEKKKK